MAETCLSAAQLSDRVEILSNGAVNTVALRGPDGFGFFGTVSFRSVVLKIPCTTRDVAVAVGRFVLSEFWATDAEIAAEKERFPLALAVALSVDS